MLSDRRIRPDGFAHKIVYFGLKMYVNGGRSDIPGVGDHPLPWPLTDLEPMKPEIASPRPERAETARFGRVAGPSLFTEGMSAGEERRSANMVSVDRMVPSGNGLDVSRSDAFLITC